MTGFFSINDLDIFTAYGLMAQKGFYAELLKMPTRKAGYTRNWPDQNGTERDLNYIEYENRSLELKFGLYAQSEQEFYSKYKALKTFFLTTLEFNLKALQMNRLFKLRYKSMPTFDKLTIIRENNKIFADITIELQDNYPKNFWRLNGTEIALTFPLPTPDAPLVFADFDFEIRGYYLFMSNESQDTGAFSYRLDGNDVFNNYGLVADKGMYNELLKFADVKSEMPLKFQSRTLELPFFLIADNEIDFYAKYYALAGFLFDSKYFKFDVPGMNRRFFLCYSSMSSIEKLTVIRNSNKIVASIKITTFDDSPTIDSGLNMYDGSFDINDVGELILTQSPEFDSDIDFYIVGINLIKNLL